MRFQSLVGLTTTLFGVSKSQTCNVESPELDLVTVQSGDFDGFEDNLKIVALNKEVSDGSVELVKREPGGVSGAAWFTEKLRLTDGFEATFEVTVSGISMHLSPVPTLFQITHVRFFLVSLFFSLLFPELLIDLFYRGSND